MTRPSPPSPPKSSRPRSAPGSRGGAPRDASASIERGFDRLGRIVSVVWLGLIGVIACAVALRFIFGIGRIELEELQWHLYAFGFLSGIVGCAVHDRHVRVDVLRERMSGRARLWVDFYGLLLLQLPFILFVAWSAIPIVIESFEVGEKSASAGGLPFRFLLRAVLPTSFALLAFASLIRLRRVALALLGPGAEDERPRGKVST